MSDFLLISALAELSSGKGFGFNSNFLEANVLNIALLVSGVFYLGQNFLTSALELRQQKDTEALVNEATQQLNTQKDKALLALEEQVNTLSEQIKNKLLSGKLTA
jgi:F-type H+-transporting ATPase subunit b